MISITYKSDLMSLSTLSCTSTANAMLVRMGGVVCGLESGLESGWVCGLGQGSQDTDDYTNVIDNNRGEEIYAIDTLDTLGFDARAIDTIEINTIEVDTLESVNAPKIKKPKKVFVRF